MRLVQLIEQSRSLFKFPTAHPEERSDEGSDLQDFEVKGISCNSKDVRDDFIFVAIKGTRHDGNAFIEEAIRKGAKTIVVQSSEFPPQADLPTAGRVPSCKNVPVIAVEDTRKALAILSAEFYGNPSREIKVVGITGTNGKTTVSYLIEALLKEAGKIPAVIGTVNYRFKDKVISSKNTTPGPVELQSMLADMLKAGVDCCLMEVSSHALHQDRIEGIKFHSAIFTNLTQDHLDYHHTIEDYFQAKTKLFKGLNTDSFAIINSDDTYGRRLKRLTPTKLISYGIDNAADIRAKDIRFDISHSEFLLTGMGKEIRLKTALIGRHNVYNILACVSFGLKEGIDLSVIESAIGKFHFVPGRLERINFPGNFSVFVDYAHTEDALSNVIRTLRQICAKRIIVVFGCGGERDKTKRPKMGYAVSELADYAVITNDNPRSEAPMDIINDIKKGIKRDNYCVIPDRMEAIKKSLSIASRGDVVLLAGKGQRIIRY